MNNTSEVAGFFITGWYVFDNFAPLQIEWHGKLWPASEHAYQAAHFFDTASEIAELVRQAKSPDEASKLANSHSGKDDPDWKNKRVDIMRELIRCRYDQHELVRSTLEKTKGMQIVEMNDTDSFWGWGPDHKGQNQLGEAWMVLRSKMIKD